MAIRLGLLAAILVSILSPVPALAHAPASKPLSAAAPKAALTPNGSWTKYHHDNAGTGYDPSAPALGTVQPTPGWTETLLDGQVYAENLIYNGLVYAATLSNTVYALDQATGLTVWSRNVGTPQSGGWQCGFNIDPTGILGTPVIDTAASRIYAVAEIAGATPTYHLFGLDLGTGTIVLDTPLVLAGFDWTTQQQRGALAVANGYVYVPFGGRAGDCGSYHGWVVAVPTSGAVPISWHTSGNAAGSWAAGGVVVDASGNVFVSTGNAIPCTAGVYSDAVVKLSPTLTLLSFFEPADWSANWCGPDSDLGSAGPLLISPTLMFMAGKRGGGFLLDPTNLGGVNGQLYPPRTPYVQADVCLGTRAGATFGSFAYKAPFVYIECEGNGLVALNVNTATPSFSPCDATCASPSWHAGAGTYGPPIVAAGAVWVASSSGLTALNAATGALIYQSAAFGINRFVTPAEAGGQVFVPSHTRIKSFSFAPAPGSVTVNPASVSFNGQAPTTASAAQTVTLSNNQSTVLNVATAALTGPNAANYIKGTDTCTAAAVPANGTCSVQVSFRPATYGGFPASLIFTYTGPGSPQTVPLYGLGVQDNQNHLYTLDGYGGLHPDGTSPSLGIAAAWPGWNIARSVALFPDGQGGYVMDGWGALHGAGNATPVVAAYWPGWDIARQVVLAPWSSQSNPAGWTLDGFGGIHPFGGAPGIVGGYATWAGWDIARGLVILPDSTPSSVAGYTLDGWGGVHPFGGAAPVYNYATWAGWDIARGITLSPDATKINPAGWTLDGFGGVHPFGTAPAISNFAYWGWDIARGIVAWTGSGSGGWVMEGYGGIHPFGNAPAVTPYAYWYGWDIATSIAGTGSNSGSRRR